MFHWICPECGREIPPAVKECPACDPNAAPIEAEKTAPEPVVSAPAPAPPPLPVEPVSATVAPVAPVSPPVESPAPVAAATPEPPPAVLLEPEPLPDPILALAEQIRAVQAQATEPEPAVVPTPELPGLQQLVTAVGLVEPTPVETVPAASSEPAPTSSDLKVAEPTPVENLAPAAAPSVALVASPEPTNEPSLDDTVELFLEPVAAPAPAEPEPPQILSPEPTPQRLEPAAVRPVAPAVEQIDLIAASVVAEPLPVAQEPVPAPPAVEEAQPAHPPIEVLPPPVMKDLAALAPEPVSTDRPPSGSWLQLAPLQDQAYATSRAIRPVAPRPQILTPDSGPRITLPGPALPPELARLQEANPVTVIGEPMRAPRRGLHGWPVTLMFGLGIPLTVFAAVLYFQPLGHPSADAKTAPPQETAAPAPPASQTLAQLVEVTGFRIVVDFNKKSEIHYLVVNHSSADLSDMTIYVTLRMGSAKTGQPPLCRFSFRAPSLGPFESKEMISPIEKLTRSIALPDWQDLRAEVQIAQ